MTYRINNETLEFPDIKYVSSIKGNDATGNGTKEKPYATLSKGESSISTNGAIIVEGIHFNGTASFKSGITYIGETIETEIRGECTINSNTLIRLTFKTQNLDGSIFNVSRMIYGSNTKFYNCFFAYHRSSDGTRELIYGSNNYFENCTFIGLPSTYTTYTYSGSNNTGINNVLDQTAGNINSSVFPIYGKSIDPTTGQFVNPNDIYLSDTYGIYGGKYGVGIHYVIRDNLYFINDNGILKYRDNNIMTNTDKTINTVKAYDFYMFGMSDLDWDSIEGKKEFIFILSNAKKTYSFISKDKIIYNKTNIVLYFSPIINNISIIDSYTSGIVKYVIFNGLNWYSYKSSQWIKINNYLDTSEILNVGMTSAEITKINTSAWQQIFDNSNDQIYLNFCAVISKNTFDSNIKINKIIITYSRTGRKKTKDNLYKDEDQYNMKQITWNTGNKTEIQLIHSR